MTDKTTWAVLTDGRYIRILINDGTNKALAVLKADDMDSYADICYQVVNCKPRGESGHSVKAEKIDYLKLQADFLAASYEEKLFDQLLVVAPEAVIREFRASLPDNIVGLIFAEHAEDLLAKSNDDIAQALADKFN